MESIVNNVTSVFSQQTQPKPKTTPAEAHQSFKTTLNDALNHVNEVSAISADKTQKLASGEIDDLHDVMIAGQKASIALQTTIEVRNKAVEAYKEIMRMQV